VHDSFWKEEVQTSNRKAYFCPQKDRCMHILLIDNYDSFTYNLVQLLKESGVPHRLSILPNTVNNEMLPSDVDKVMLSPGPGIPHESGNLMELVSHFAPTTPMLGICLGHQALALFFGCKLKHTNICFHGFAGETFVSAEGDYLFGGIPASFVCGRYHSWLIDPESLGHDIEVTATDPWGNIMSIRHRNLDIRGLQFHPESYMTAFGARMIANWLKK
jgi:anthranilate synthase component II